MHIKLDINIRKSPDLKGHVIYCHHVESCVDVSKVSHFDRIFQIRKCSLGCPLERLCFCSDQKTTTETRWVFLPVLYAKICHAVRMDNGNVKTTTNL
jgi:hypothetical protein